MSFKQQIKNIPVLGKITQQLYSRVRCPYRNRMNPSYWLPKILRQKEAVVVQIGSNDGKTGDPLYDLLMQQHNWSALFVEPVPYLFQRLRSNYSSVPRFTFENSVINDGSNVRFYWVAEEAKTALPGLPAWYDQLGGFNRSHITKLIPQLDSYIREAELPGLTLDGLFEKHGIKDLDLLHIDTEGADYKILSQLDLAKYRPRVILYERKHLSREEEEESISFLNYHYDTYTLGRDMLAVEKRVNRSMKHILRPLKTLRTPALAMQSR